MFDFLLSFLHKGKVKKKKRRRTEYNQDVRSMKALLVSRVHTHKTK